MNNKKMFSITALLLAIVMILGACGGGATEEPSTSAPPASESAGSETAESETAEDEASAGTQLKDSITIAQPVVVSTLDPLASNNVQTSNVIMQLYNGLLYQDKDGVAQPDLAESMDVSEDGCTLTFKLREGVKFSNGDPLTVEDVVFTLDRAMNDYYLMAQMSNIKNIETPDASTVILNLEKPDRILPITLASNYLAVVNKKAVEAAGEDYGSNADIVGTGAYKVKEWVQSVKIILERNDDYFNNPPQIKTITYVPIADQNTTLIALQSGDVDFTYQGITSSARETVMSDSSLQLLEDASTASRLLYINTKKKPFDNVLVRQALSHAINREDLVLLATGGNGVPTETALSEQNMSAYTKGVPTFSYDPEKAKALLAEAGYPDGFEATIITREIYKRVAEVLQDQLSEAGITINVEVLDSGAEDALLNSGEYDLCAEGIGLSYPDPDALLSKIYESTGMFQYSFYKNDEVDKLLNDARSTYKKDEIIDYYNSALTIVNNEMPLVPMYYEKANFAYRKGLNIPFFPAFGLYRVEDFAWTE